MKCILLCAGYATRLAPLTDNLPKALLKVDDKEILTYIIEKVNFIDEVDEIIIVSNDKFYDMFVEYSKDVNTSKNIRVINDLTNKVENRLGVIGDLKYSLHLGNINEEVLLIAGDSMFEYNLNDLIDYYRSVNNSVVVCKELNDKEELKRMGLVEVNNNNVISFEEKPSKPKSDIATYATYIFTKEVIAFVKEYDYEYFSKDKPLIEYVYKDFGLTCFLTDKECYDVGTHDSLKFVKDKYEKH